MIDSALTLVLVSAGATIFFLPLLRRFALRLRITDNPVYDSLKVHPRPIPHLGGIAMLLGLGVASLFVHRDVLPLGILIFFIIANGFGLIDDIFWQKRTRRNLLTKVLFQLVLALAFVFSQLIIPVPSFVGLALTAFIYLLVINATNMQDGLDGLLGGIACISAIGFFFLFFIAQHIPGMTLSALLSGVTLGFLVFNFPPARLFMGDNGSYLIGTIFSFLILFLLQVRGLAALGPALLLIGMPLLNVVFVTTRRACVGQSPLVGDRLHVYDIIHARLASPLHTLALNYAMHAGLVTIGILLLVV